MRRELKFRAWDGNKLVFGWGAYTNDSDKQWVLVDREDGVRGQTMVDGKLMQYSGLKDKNGKEIYEGDIVGGEFLYGAKKLGVHFSEKQFGWYPFVAAMTKPEECEVIGNIYQNPEL